jgi:hypothetical protein
VREARWVDSVPFGCYRRQVFDRIGLFDKDLAWNQDNEFNLRLIRSQGRILLVSHVVSHHHARDSLGKLWRAYYQYGYFKPLVVRKVRGSLTVRQVMPAAFVAAVGLTRAPRALGSSRCPRACAGIVGAYVLALLACSVRVGVREGAGVGLLLWVVFPVLHVSYGLGYFRGIFDFLILGKRSVPRPTAVQLSR